MSIASDIISAAMLHYGCEAVTINFTLNEDGEPLSYTLWIQEEAYGQWTLAIEALDLESMYQLLPPPEETIEQAPPERPSRVRWPTNVRFNSDWPGGRCDPQRP